MCKAPRARRGEGLCCFVSGHGRASSCQKVLQKLGKRLWRYPQSRPILTQRAGDRLEAWSCVRSDSLKQEVWELGLASSGPSSPALPSLSALRSVESSIRETSVRSAPQGSQDSISLVCSVAVEQLQREVFMRKERLFVPRTASAALVPSKGSKFCVGLDHCSSELGPEQMEPASRLCLRDSPRPRSGVRALTPVCLRQRFSELRAGLISSQPLPKQEALAQCFRSLMEGVEQNLSVKNRDR